MTFFTAVPRITCPSTHPVSDGSRPTPPCGKLPRRRGRPAAVSAMKSSLGIIAALFLIAGCHSEPPPLEFEPNLVYSMKYQINEGIPMEQAGKDAFWIVSEMFGTPENPELPTVVTENEELASLVTLDHLERASGRLGEEGRGLYQTHCVTCHGTTGNGRGELSSTMAPYPRDYRKGVFKYKSTARGAKPTREDLAGLIKNGINGTRMVAIPNLTEDDVEALVDYVIYLSWRGELERQLLDDAVYELDFESGDRIIDPAAKDATGEAKEAFDESWELAEDFATEIGESWLEAPDEVVEAPDPPEGFVVPDSHEQFLAAMQDDRAETLEASVQRGRKLFKGKIASCSKCHGEEGRGDGQNTDYDDWTKEWTLSIGIQPDDRESLIKLLARGALPPLNATPRNFASGAFHGGSTAKDLYLRITEGIEGTPMPAVTFVPGEFEEDDVWHLINFIRSLQEDPDEPAEPTPEPTPDAALTEAT